MTAPVQTPDTPEVVQQRESVTRGLAAIAKALGMNTDPKDQPIVDPEEVRRHDEQFERENPNWEREHGGRR